MPLAVAPAPDATHDYRAPLRAWHWLNAALVTGQLLTILFQKVIVDARGAVTGFLAQQPAGAAAPNARQLKEFAHLISERIWQWHIYLGLTLAAAWLLRAVLELRGPAERRFSARLLAVARRYRLAPPAGQPDARQELLVKGSYALLYLLLTGIVITGLLLVWADDLPALHQIEHSVKEVHEVTMYGIIGFIVVHVVGVVRAELTTRHGLISRMVGGR